MTAPMELLQMGLDAGRFHKARANEWHGPCPRCGGTDRFRVHTDRPWPHWYAICREGTGCGFKGWADQLAPELRALTQAERDQWAAQQAREREERDQRRRERLATFTTAELWAELHERLTEEHRAWWRSQGVPDDWQDHLRLGYTPERQYRAGAELKTSPAYCIPYFHTGFEFQTMQYRLFQPPTPTDRYRFEYGLPTTYYQAEPVKPIGDEVIICEGAKKAMVVQVYGVTRQTVLAVPSKSDFGGVAEAVAECGRVWIILDPDADAAARHLAEQVGPQARVVTLPGKVDDLIVHYGATRETLAAALRMAR